MQQGDLMISPDLVKILEYDLTSVSYDGILVDADKLLIHPVEIGNKIEVKKKENMVLTFSIKKLTGIETTTEKKGLLKKGDAHLKIGIRKEGEGEKTLLIKVDENKIREISDEIKNNFDAENNPFWELGGAGLYEKGDSVEPIWFGANAPRLAEGEEILWERTKLDGILNKYVHALEVITNYRIAFFDFIAHTSIVEMPFGLDTVIANQKRHSESIRQGNFVGRSLKGSFFGTSQGFSSSTSENIGDVILMDDDKPVFTFYQVSDPHGVERLLKVVINANESLDEKRMTNIKKQNTILKGEQTCSKCGHVNPTSSKFCNKCGSKIV